MSGAGPGFEPFEQDVLSTGGYRYTAPPQQPAGQPADHRRQPGLGRLGRQAGHRPWLRRRHLHRRPAGARPPGQHPRGRAVGGGRGLARARSCDPRLSFAEGSAYRLPHADNEFDLAYLRGVLHHMDRPLAALSEALRVAPVVVVVEPNGYNLGLKVLEKVSPYHREHAERSYAPRQLDQWAAGLGGTVVARRFIGFVPMFCPDRYAEVAKRIEPALERRPGLRNLTCAQYVFTIAQGS